MKYICDNCKFFEVGAFQLVWVGMWDYKWEKSEELGSCCLEPVIVERGKGDMACRHFKGNSREGNAKIHRHTHPKLEGRLGVPKGHVIIDADTYLALVWREL